MAEIDLELLMAYADNELDEEQRAKVEAIIAKDPEAASMVARFRETRGQLGESFNHILDQPVPENLIDTIRNHKPKTTIIPFRSTRIPSFASNWISHALAASLALIIGITAGAMIFDKPMDKQSSITAAEMLQHTLESQPTGKKIATNDMKESVTPVLTFSTSTGQICREYERQVDTNQFIGVACRSRDKKWNTVVEIDKKLLATPPSIGEEYAPAAGLEDPLAAALAALGAQKSFTAEAEQRLRKNGWQ